MSVRSDTGPFAIVPAWLIDTPISDRAVRLYALLARRADNETDQCWPSRATLARDLDCSVSSVDRAIDELEGAKAVTVERRRNEKGDPTSNLYTVCRMDPLGDSRFGGVAAPVQPPSRTGDDTGSRTADALSRPSSNYTHLRESPSSNGHRKGRKTPVPDPFELTDERLAWVGENVPGLDPFAATQEWLTACAANDYRYVNWNAAWHNAMRRAARWHKTEQVKR